MQAYDLSDVIQILDEFKTDDDKDDKKKFFKALLRVILSYHILPSNLNVGALSDNNTFATNLVLPDTLGARPLRIRVTQGLHPITPIINLYSEIIRPEVHTSNGKLISNMSLRSPLIPHSDLGIIHGINHPLLPPPSLFQELYMGSSSFSTFVRSNCRTLSN
jgi:hypothetical protein